MISCEDALHRIHEFIDGELEDVSSEQVKAHFDVCGRCYPHLQLEESFWDHATQTATTRWWIVEARSAEVTRHAQTVQAYDGDGYRQLLEEAGFADVRFHPSLTGEDATGEDGLFAISARRAAP